MIVGLGRVLLRRPCNIGAAFVVLAILAIGELTPIGGRAAVRWWADMGWTLCAIMATAGCVVAAMRGPRGRPAWLCFAAGCATWLCGELAWDYYELVAHVAPPIPSLGDAGWLGFVPWFAAGLLLLPRRRAQRHVLAFFALDLIVLALAFTLIGVVASQDLLLSSSALTLLGKATSLAYPVAYLTLGLGTFLILVRDPRLASTRSLGLLTLGLFCEGAGFVAWAPLLLTDSYQDGSALDLVWMAGLLAIGLAGLEWQPPRELESADDGHTFAQVALGLIPTVLGTAVVLV